MKNVCVYIVLQMPTVYTSVGLMYILHEGFVEWIWGGNERKKIPLAQSLHFLIQN